MRWLLTFYQILASHIFNIKNQTFLLITYIIILFIIIKMAQRKNPRQYIKNLQQKTQSITIYQSTRQMSTENQSNNNIKTTQPTNDSRKIINQLQKQNNQLKSSIQGQKQKIQFQDRQLQRMKKSYLELEEHKNQEIKGLRRQKQYFADVYQKYRKLEYDFQGLKERNRMKINDLKNKISYVQNYKIFESQERNIQNRSLKEQISLLKSSYDSNLQEYQATKKLIQQIQNQSKHINMLHFKLIQKEQSLNTRLVDLSKKEKQLQLQLIFNHDTFNKVQSELVTFIRNEQQLGRKYEQLKGQNEELKELIKKDRQESKLLYHQLEKEKSQNLQKQLKDLQKFVAEEMKNQKNKVKGQKKQIQQLHQRINQKYHQISFLKIQLQCKNQQILIKQPELKKNMQEIQILGNKLQKTQLYLKTNKKQLQSLKKNLQLQKQQKQQLRQQNLSRSFIKNNQENKIIYMTNLIMSYILKYKDYLSKEIILNIEKISGKRVKNVQLLFKQDGYHLNFAPYLTKKIALLMIIEIKQNGRICGAFCNTQIDNKAQNSFIFSFQQENIKIFDKQSKENSIKAYNFVDNSLIFGNNELILKNNNQKKILKLNMTSFSSKFYRCNNKNQITGSNENEVNYEVLQLHRIDFE